MSTIVQVPVLAPFRVRSFRYQWPADLATSWAFEMENLILGWYVLVETRSVFMLTVYASLQYLGTLFAPMFGVMGDRVGHRNVLCAMRGAYAVLATILTTLVFGGLLTPLYVIVVAALMGLLRPSDIGMRNALIGVTIPGPQLMGAMGIQRTTQDSARVAGSLSGAGLVALLGMGPAYLVVIAFYSISVLLTWRAGSERSSPRAASVPASSASPLRDLTQGIAYVWTTPQLLAVMLLAFVLNGTAFPLFNSLLPYVAKEVYGADQATLGAMAACGALGSLLGSVVLSRQGRGIGPGRQTIVCAAGWYVLLLVFAQIEHPAAGLVALFFAGCLQSAGLVPMSAILLRSSEAGFRGRVMGIRMLALYANLPGLLLAAPLIAWAGYCLTASFYCLIGLALTGLITLRWRACLWHRQAATNQG